MDGVFSVVVENGDQDKDGQVVFVLDVFILGVVPENAVDCDTHAGVQEEW